MTRRYPEGGFSLIEALVALLVITIGLLGVAGLQALAFNNTHTASLRSIAAIEASNMAAYMDANPAFWREIPPSSVTVVPVNGSVNFTGVGGSTMAGYLPTSCTTTSCVPNSMAAWDMQNWGSSLGQQLPSAEGGVQCGNGIGPGASTTSIPMTCVVTVRWQEKNLALNPGSTGSSAPLPSSSTENYSLVVQP